MENEERLLVHVRAHEAPVRHDVARRQTHDLAGDAVVELYVKLLLESLRGASNARSRNQRAHDTFH